MALINEPIVFWPYDLPLTGIYPFKWSEIGGSRAGTDQKVNGTSFLKDYALCLPALRGQW
jgi:hypothetical protein